jgi:putative LysE/RhtB family amino acid efflux pump
MALAVAAVDVLYGTLGLAGVGRLFDAGGVRLTLGIACAVVLVAIGLRTIWTGVRARSGFETVDDVVAPRRAFVTAVAATALNPLTIALWTLTFPAAIPAAAGASTAHVAEAMAGVALGTVTWYCGLATAVALVRRRVGGRLLRAVDLAAGCALVAFGLLLGDRAVAEG